MEKDVRLPDGTFSILHEEMEHLRKSLTIRLAVIQFFAYGLLYAALKLT